MPAITEPPKATPEPQIKDTGPNPQSALAGFMSKLQKKPEAAAPEIKVVPTETQAQPHQQPAPNQTQSATTKEDANWPRTAADWKALKAAQAKEVAERESAIAALKKETSELQAKLKTLPAEDPEKPILKSQIEELRGQVKEFSEQLYSAARERHPEFVAKYDKKIEAAMKLADTVSGREISKLLQLPEGEYRDEKLQEIFDDLPELKRSRLGPILNDIDVLRSQRASELSTSREEFEAMVKKHQLDTTAAQEKKAKEELAMVESMWADAQAKRATLKPRDGDEAFNKALMDRINAAREVMLGKADPETVINTMLNAAEKDIYQSEAESLREEVRQLKEQISTVKGAAPRLAEPGTQKGDGKVPVSSGMSPRQAMAAWIQNTVKAGT